MKKNSILLILKILITSTSTILAFDPIISGGIAAGVASSVGYFYYEKALCALKECCHDLSSNKWINSKPNFKDLDEHIFGQHIALKIVPILILQHINDPKPSKPLVLSFHGYTGIGKNHFTSLLMKAIYKKYNETGSSNFVHTFVATHLNEYEKDKKHIIKLIDEIVNRCERSVIIFDEVDKFQPKFTDILLPYLDFHAKWKKMIYIFISNSAGKAINTQVDNLLENGKQREDITYNDLEFIVETSAKSALEDSELIERGVIDFFIPFLPLEHEHVEKCIIYHLKNKRNFKNPEINPGQKFIKQVIDQILFQDKKYSFYGCKRVASKTDTLLMN